MNNKLKVLVSVIVMSFVMIGCGGEEESGTSVPSVDNSTRASGENQYGYFGENILIGNSNVVGSWKLNNLEDNTYFGIVTFYADGDGELNTGTIYDIDYGVSSDGKTIKIGGEYSVTMTIRSIIGEGSTTVGGITTTNDVLKVDYINSSVDHTLAMLPNYSPQ